MDGTVAPLFRAMPDCMGLGPRGGRAARLEPEDRVFPRSARCVWRQKMVHSSLQYMPILSFGMRLVPPAVIR